MVGLNDLKMSFPTLMILLLSLIPLHLTSVILLYFLPFTFVNRNTSANSD